MGDVDLGAERLESLGVEVKPSRTDRVTAGQKARIYEGIARLLLDVLDKPLELTWVVFREIELEDWSIGGLPISDYRRQRDFRR